MLRLYLHKNRTKLRNTTRSYTPVKNLSDAPIYDDFKSYWELAPQSKYCKVDAQLFTFIDTENHEAVTAHIENVRRTVKTIDVLRHPSTFEPPFAYSCYKSSLEMTKLLHKLGCSPLEPDFNNVGALHFSCLKSSYDHVEYLLRSCRVSTHQQGNYGLLPIDAAVKPLTDDYSRVGDILQLLLEEDLKIYDATAEQIMSYYMKKALQKGGTHAVEYLLTKMSKDSVRGVYETLEAKMIHTDVLSMIQKQLGIN
eukprot:TRINITY_DN9935_c0_g1_i1.p1 TRINITY_DN9935_c0_g1~~TRINITY_DN9935_c0_g1_i1.p1  ORF type:complete len:253 (-),score=41.25 TRINITY_DN9935_c0_g1_i1:8-766(-)